MQYYLSRRMYLRLASLPEGAPESRRRLYSALFEAACFYQRLRKNPFRDVHRDTRSIYVHVPKTGGNSVKRIVYRDRHDKAGGHIAAWEFQAHAPLLFADSFVFATVRHPLSRLQSAFRYLKGGGMNERDRRWSEKNLAGIDSLKDFFAALQNADTRRRLLRWVHFLPQSYFLCDVEGKPIVQHFVKVEDFDAGLQAVCTRLGIAFEPRKVNVTPGVAKREFDPDILRMAHALYRRDYEIAGYDIEPPARP